MIALDPDHAGPGLLGRVQRVLGFDPEAPMWCEWEWVFPDDCSEPYIGHFPPYGQTVSEIEASWTEEG
jgi:hypothetical protein